MKAKEEEEITNLVNKFSWQIFPYWRENWEPIISDFVFWLRPAKLDVFLDTNNSIESFFGRLKTELKRKIQ